MKNTKTTKTVHSRNRMRRMDCIKLIMMLIIPTFRVKVDAEETLPLPLLVLVLLLLLY